MLNLIKPPDIYRYQNYLLSLLANAKLSGAELFRCQTFPVPNLLIIKLADANVRLLFVEIYERGCSNCKLKFVGVHVIGTYNLKSSNLSKADLKDY